MTPEQMKGMMSSATSEWATPQDFFDKLNLIYGFELDVCATPENAKCARFFTKEQDGLVQEWTGYVWMNPPYGRERLASGCVKPTSRRKRAPLWFAYCRPVLTPLGGTTTARRGGISLCAEG